MFGTFRYFFKEGMKNIYMNGLMSVASVIVMVCCLVMTGMAFVVYQNIQNALKGIEKNNSMTVYLEYGVPADLDEVHDKICQIDNIESCSLYSKDDAIKEYEGLLGDSISSLFQGEDNPLPDAFKISMKDLSLYDDTIDKIMDIDVVDSISDKSEIAKKLTDLKKLVSVVGFWINLGLAIVSLMIISNTIRITMHNRRFEISIMKSVGATNSFIRAPFIIEGFMLGLISAILSITILHIVCVKAIGLINNIIPLNSLFFEETFKKIVISFVLSGSLLGVFASIISIKKYLKKEGGISVAW